MTRRAATALAILAACGGSRSAPSEETVLRVSAVTGLSSLVPGQGDGGSSAAAMDLIYDFLPTFIESVERRDNVVLLRRRTDAGLTSQQLASSLRYRGLVSARAIDSMTVEAVMESDSLAHYLLTTQDAGFETGPFRIDQLTVGRTILRRRDGSGIPTIEIVPTTRQDEWRRLMAGDLDVIPLASSLFRDQFAGVDSIRVLDVPPTAATALYFNVRQAKLAQATTRRALAARLNRPAIARIACGSAECAIPWSAAPGDLELESVVVLVLKDDSTLITASQVLRHQLEAVGVRTEIQLVELATFATRTSAGDFDLALGPLSLSERKYQFFRSTSPGTGSITGFADAEYDAVLDRGDLDAAQAILDREVPVTPLFEQRAFAAVDARFCGDVTPSATSWRWMADLYPCEEGAEEP